MQLRLKDVVWDVVSVGVGIYLVVAMFVSQVWDET